MYTCNPCHMLCRESPGIYLEPVCTPVWRSLACMVSHIFSFDDQESDTDDAATSSDIP